MGNNIGKKGHMPADSDRDIGEVIRAERRRTQRQPDEELVALQRQFERDFYRLIREGDEKKFRAFLNAHALQAGQADYLCAMEKWRDYQKQRRKP